MGIKVEILNNQLPGYTGNAWLVKKGANHFVVSGTSVLGVWEVLVFKSDENGLISDFMPVCGSKKITHEEAIKQLEESK